MGIRYEYVEGYPLLAGGAARRRGSGGHAQGQAGHGRQEDLILHPSNLWLTIHESVGHPTELDRALGYEANFAGTSFATPDKLGKLEFGAQTVNIYADKTTPGPGHVRLRRRRRQDPALGHRQERHLRRLPDHARPGAADRREGVARHQLRRQLVVVPFQRMPNVSLAPGAKDLTEKDMIARDRRRHLHHRRLRATASITSATTSSSAARCSRR